VQRLDPIRRNTYLLLTAFWLVAMGVAAAGYRYYAHEKATIESEERLQLASIVGLKVRQVADWRSERIADARIMSAWPVSPAVSEFLQRGQTSARSEHEITGWLETIRNSAGYANVILVSTQHNRWIGAGQQGHAQSTYIALGQDVVKRGEAVLTDFHNDGGLHVPHLGLNVPLRITPEGPPAGALLIGIDPNTYLYPMVQSWPTNSRTAETLLAARDGDEVVYLNELRHRKDTALRLRLPLQSPEVPAARGALGFEGIMTGVDYRGVPVLAAVRRVPDTPWILVAKIDVGEIHAAVERQTFWLALMGLSVLLTIGIGVTFLLRDLRARFVHQQRRADRERRLLRDHYDYLSKYANDIILLTNDRGVLVEANDRAVNTYGYPREELLGIPLLQLRAPETTGAFREDWRITELQESVIFETRHRRKDGTTFPVEVSARRVTVDGEVYRQSIIRDITERREAECERVQLQEQLQQAQRLESIGRLAGGVAHDFNNLLTVINGYSAMVIDALPTDDPLRDEVHEIAEAGRRATDLTRQLLAFSRKQVIAPKVEDLNVIVAGVAKMLRRLVGEDITIVTELAPVLDSVYVDAGQIEQVLMNLATNARDAMPHGGSLTIETSNANVDRDYAASHIEATPGAHSRLKFTDSGEGMTAETLQHAFEPFFTTKPRGQGTGLGLSTVYGAIKQAKGWVTVDSEVGRGTSFCIYLPSTPAGAGESGTAGTAPAAGNNSSRGTESVLVVEDQPEVRKLTADALRYYGYRVLEASGGEAALRLCSAPNAEIALIVTDVIMPGMTGPELAEQVAGIRPDVKVLFMSGYSETFVAHQGIVEAGLAYLQKPFTADALGRMARQVLDGHPASK
jgi:PAS domain S-box-containing protein